MRYNKVTSVAFLTGMIVKLFVLSVLCVGAVPVEFDERAINGGVWCEEFLPTFFYSSACLARQMLDSYILTISFNFSSDIASSAQRQGLGSVRRRLSETRKL